jgi:FdhD protein
MINFWEIVKFKYTLDNSYSYLSNKKQLPNKDFTSIKHQSNSEVTATFLALPTFTLITLAHPVNLIVNWARKTQLVLFFFQHGQLKRYA